MNKELTKQAMRMKYNIKKDMKVISSARLEVITNAKRSFMSSYTIEEIEDSFMDSLMYNYKRALQDPKFAESMTISSITYKMRQMAYRNIARKFGHNLDGSIPKYGKNLHVKNLYDEPTHNSIEKFGYDKDSNLIIGN